MRTHFDSDLPQIGVMNGRHEQPLRYLIHIPGVADGRAPVPLAVLSSDLLEVLVIELPFSVESCVDFRTRCQAFLVALTTHIRNELIYGRSVIERSLETIGRRTSTILILVLVFLFVFVNLGLNIEVLVHRWTLMAMLRTRKIGRAHV